MTILTGIKRAVEVSGSQAKLAEKLGCTQQLISIWLGRGYVPVERVVEIEQATGVSRNSLINPKLLNLLTPFSG